MPSRFDGMIKAYCKPYRDGASLPPLLSNAGLTGRLVDPSLKGWEDPDTGLKVTGYLDECLETPEGNYTPLDHKTRGWPPESVHHTYQVQLDIYTLMLQGNGYPISAQGILVYYTYDESDLDRGIVLSISSFTLPTYPRAALNLVHRAAKVLALKEPPLSYSGCRYCQWITSAGRWTMEDT